MRKVWVVLLCAAAFAPAASASGSKLFSSSSLPTVMRALHECEQALTGSNFADTNNAEVTSQTQGYLSLIHKLIEKGVLSRAQIDELLLSAEPVNPVEKAALASEERFVYFKVFKRLLEGAIDWDQIKARLRVVLNELSERQESRVEAREDTAPIAARVLIERLEEPVRTVAPNGTVGTIANAAARRANNGNTFVYFQLAEDQHRRPAVYNVATRRTVRLEGEAEWWQLSDPITTPDGRSFAAIGDNESIRVFSLDTGKIVKRISGLMIHGLRVASFKAKFLNGYLSTVETDLFFAENGRPMLLVRRGGNALCIVDAVTGRTRATGLPEEHMNFRRSEDGRKVVASFVATGPNETFRFFELDENGSRLLAEVPIGEDLPNRDWEGHAYERYQFYTTKTGKEYLLVWHWSGFYVYDVAAKTVVRRSFSKGLLLPQTVILEPHPGEVWVVGPEEDNTPPDLRRTVTLLNLTDPTKDLHRSLSGLGYIIGSSTVEAADGTRRVLLKLNQDTVGIHLWVWDPIGDTENQLPENAVEPITGDSVIKGGWGAFITDGDHAFELIQIYGPPR